MADQPLLENEFEGKDAKGLQAATDTTPTEAAEKAKYKKLILGFIPMVGQALAWGTYFGLSYLGGQKEMLDEKFAFVHKYQLGYVFLTTSILSLGRKLLVIEANAARAPARVDRPDQHVYKVMAADGAMKDAPYVMMANTGLVGRFNRAQRGVFNTDEALPMVLVNSTLTASIFGPVVAAIAALGSWGRVKFGKGYKESNKGRMGGMLPAFLAEGWIENLALLCAIKGIFHPYINF